MAAPDMPDHAGFRDVLASVDSAGRRTWVGARILWGRWRARRFLLAIPLIVFYCAIPFVSIGGAPALRIDFAGRKLWLYGTAFWPQDLAFLVLVVLLGIVGTLLMVAWFGRVFCGWLCPHNVFLEMVFRPVEHLLLGGPGNPATTRWWRAALMWLVFALIAGGLANAGTAIFVGADAFRYWLVLDWAAHPYATVFWAVLFACILFNFGWFREQTCTIVCPYGRFQSAMLDPHTLTVAYDAKRGEPRGHLVRADARAATSSELRALSPHPAPPTSSEVATVPADAASKLQAPGSSPPAPMAQGDCIDCGLCVRVCPTGIDIRNGNQLECIHCTACIDACDRIMDKVARPRGLIRFASEEELAGRRRRVLRLRNLLYLAVFAALAGLLAWRLAGRTEVLVSPLTQTVLPVRERDPAGRDCVRAVLPLSLVNHGGAPLGATVVLPGLDALVVLPQPRLELPGGTRATIMPIVYIPVGKFAGRRLDVPVELHADDGRILGRTMVAVRTP